MTFEKCWTAEIMCEYLCWRRIVWVEVESIFFCWMKIVWVEVEWIFALNESIWRWSWMNVYLLNVNINPWMKILCSWILLQTANHTPTLFKVFFSWSLMFESYKLFPLLVFSLMVGLKLGRKFALACQHIILKLGSHHGAVSVLKSWSMYTVLETQVVDCILKLVQLFSGLCLAIKS